MFSICHKASFCRYLLAAIWFSILSGNALAIGPAANNLAAPKNWFQVEVILFDQQSILGSEQAPEEYSLTFQDNWLALSGSYRNTAIMGRPLFDKSSTASLKDSYSPSLTEQLSKHLGIITTIRNDGSRLVPEAIIPYQHDSGNEIMVGSVSRSLLTNKIPSTEFKPVYEQSFQKLQRDQRDLNDTARALKRRNYKVLFHEAWRFKMYSKDVSPWILVKAGVTSNERYQIEGMLRFYKSRHMHFETDLWRLNFSESKDKIVTLPEIPQPTITPDKAALLKALQFTKELAGLIPLSAIQRLENNGTKSIDNNLLDLHSWYNLDEVMPVLNTQKGTSHTAAQGDVNNHHSVKEVWPIKHSKRIQVSEVYYIDHPQMGALVTIKKFEPTPINLTWKAMEEIETSIHEVTN